MAIGTTTNFELTRNDLIDLSYSIIGVNEPDIEEYNLASKVLNSLVHNLDGRGTWLWAIDTTETQLTLVGGQAEYGYTTLGAPTEIAPDILRLEWAAVLEGADDRRVLAILPKKEAISTVLKDDTQAEPLAVHLEVGSRRSSNKMVFYPTPNAAYTIVYHYRRPLFEFDGPTDNPDMPQEWFLPLQKMLAYELASHFGKPLPERQLLQLEAEKAFAEMTAHNSEPPSGETLATEYF